MLYKHRSSLKKYIKFMLCIDEKKKLRHYYYFFYVVLYFFAQITRKLDNLDEREHRTMTWL